MDNYLGLGLFYYSFSTSSNTELNLQPILREFYSLCLDS